MRGLILGLILGLIAALAWRHRARVMQLLTASPAWLWVSLGVAVIFAWASRSRPAASEMPETSPPPPPPSRPTDHAQDIPIETIPDADAPLTPDARDGDELLLWLEQRAARRSDPTD